LLFLARGAVYRRSMRSGRSRLLAVLGVAILVPAILTIGALPAAAQATCAFDEPTGVVTIAMASNLPATVVRSTDAIALDGVACGTATVTNTDLIGVTGPGGGPEEIFTIDLSGGAFAPGRTAESDPDAEIEFQVSLGEASTLRIAGGAVDESITAGTEGVNLNAAEATGDPDVVITGAPALEILGREGVDDLSVNGGDGTGEPMSDVLLDGGAGDDTLAGRIGGSTLIGGDGVDTLDYSTAGPLNANLATGVVQPLVGFVDFVETCENVIGSGENDVLVGDGGDNSLLGGEGDDILDGGKGDDELDGGAGNDTASYDSSNTAVVVSLKAGKAEGYGDDALSGIENVEGSRRGDELTGDGTPNELSGGAGPDVIASKGKGDILVGGKGGDDLSGGKGRDVLDGGQGRDVLDGGKSKDTCIPGKDPDSWTNCETVKL
jgi:Ca2+-binding RTX toxin-like protein